MVEYIRIINEEFTEYKMNGALHREDGPAYETAGGTKFWFLNGVRHREDGPAMEYADGRKFWFIHGEQLTEEEFDARTNPGPRYLIKFYCEGNRYYLLENGKLSQLRSDSNDECFNTITTVFAEDVAATFKSVYDVIEEMGKSPSSEVLRFRARLLEII